MGQAKQRGTYEQRVAQAVADKAQKAAELERKRQEYRDKALKRGVSKMAIAHMMGYLFGGKPRWLT